MAALEYHRPKTLNEALELLERGVPLAGGTHLTPRLRGIEALVDLQDLGLNKMAIGADNLEFGGMVTLQDLVAQADRLPSALVRTAKLEAGWNIRNRATLAGTLVAANGRSPLATTLLAMDAQLVFAPGDEVVPLATLLANADGSRPWASGRRLITAIQVEVPERLDYEQVARSPVDRPQVCAAVAIGETLRVALGGYGGAPLLIAEPDGETAAKAAGNAYADAGDVWASAEFRASVAETLVRRLVGES